jgi:hypothetical protein
VANSACTPSSGLELRAGPVPSTNGSDGCPGRAMASRLNKLLTSNDSAAGVVTSCHGDLRGSLSTVRGTVSATVLFVKGSHRPGHWWVGALEEVFGRDFSIGWARGGDGSPFWDR